MTNTFLPSAIIFDFDGVIVDSEVPANHALAESLTAIGLPTSFADSLRLYCGHNAQETERRIIAQLGRPLPPEWNTIRLERGQHWFGKGLEAVPGASAFLERATPLPRAIASSSRLSYIAWALRKTELAGHFGTHLYSADGMARGKPHPDIYLKAAAGLGIPPEDCMAIEDSPVGASAAVAAGMHTVGLCAASHIMDRAAHADALRAVGVHRIAFSYDEISIPELNASAA